MVKAKHIFPAFLFIVSMLTLTSCATNKTKYLVNIDTLSSGAANAKSAYLMIPGSEAAAQDDLQFNEYATYVDRALMNHGFTPAKSPKETMVLIFLNYGIGDPQQHRYTYSTPIIGQTGVSSSYSTGTLSTYGNYSSYSGTTTNTPTYGVTGSVRHTGTRTTYDRFITLSAFDVDEYRSSKNASKLWETSITSTGASGDLRLVFPVMVAASQEYIGINTGRKIEVDIYATDERITEIKGLSTP